MSIKEILNRIFHKPQLDEILKQANVFYVAEKYDEALKLYKKILRFDSKNYAALCNAGSVYLFQKKYVEVAKTASLLIEYFPNQAHGYSLRGRYAMEIENFEQAITNFREALAVDSDDYWNYNYLSQALQKNGENADALDCAYQAVERSQGKDSQHLNLAYALYEIGAENGREVCLPILKKWHQKYANNPIVMQSWNAFFSDKKFSKSESQYVEKVFDHFAASFDEVLRGLRYDSPQKIAEVVKQKNLVNAKILDLGCGTGLCAETLSSILSQNQIIGVDISSKMLEVAATKKLYSKLEKVEIESYLTEQKELFDGVISADVLTYFGALEKVFLGVFSCLKKGGFFVFSISSNYQNNEDWFLHLSGRFLHSQNYLKNCLKKCGFCDLNFEESILRKEGEKDVQGWIVSAQK